MTDNPDRYKIIAFRPELRENLLEVQQYLWGPDRHRNAAYFDWKYNRNPYLSSSFVRLALFEGQVVGAFAMIGAELEAGQPPHRFSCLEHADAVVHPDHRRRGLFERMTRALLEDAAGQDFEYIIDTSAHRASAATILKVGWRSPGPVETASWHADWEKKSTVRALAKKLPFLRAAYRQLRQRLPAVPAPPASQGLPFDALDKGRSQIDGAAGGHISMGTSPRPEAMADLVARIGSDGRIRHTRDRRFFAWRFGNPLSVYRFLFWDDGRLEGYLVLQAPVDAADDYWIHIVDWEATGTQVRAGLLEAAMEHTPSQMLVIWSATLSDEVKTLLKSHAFHFSSDTTATDGEVWQPHVLVRPVRSDIPPTDWRLGDRDLLNLADWDLRAIYSDNF